ncbi:glycosyltransferase family 4 protein [Rhizobium helianthi]|uniref:Glycosyltransferase family 4 protein n=1 Tax=Rhizobium helianthi TaxID=1132695 RepID=A0ABW4M5U3_9HYPH
MTRILYLTSSDYAALTGGHIYNTHLFSALRHQGQDPRVLKLHAAFPDISAQERSIVMEHLRSLPAECLLLMDHVYLCRLRQELADSPNPIAAIFHHSDVMEHGTDADEEGQSLRSIEKAALQLATKIIVSSGETQRYLATQYGISTDRILVAIPGNPPAHKGTAGQIDAGPLRILSVGALIPRKRYHHIIQAASQLGNFDWHWNIVGDPRRQPDHVEELKAQVRTLGLENRLRFLEDVSDAELEALRLASDICVGASFYEGYGMAIAEALRHGIPVVTTASGAVSTWAGAGVLQVDAERPLAMAQAINQLAEDRATLLKLADEAWRFGQALPDWQTTFTGLTDWLLTPS